VADAAWGAPSGRWTEPQVRELVVLAGSYRLVSGLLNSAGVALEARTPGWPEGSNPVRSAPRDAS
jgi:hypothetical protein